MTCRRATCTYKEKTTASKHGHERWERKEITKEKGSEQRARNKKKGEFLVMEYFPFLEKAKRKKGD